MDECIYVQSGCNFFTPVRFNHLHSYKILVQFLTLSINILRKLFNVRI